MPPTEPLPFTYRGLDILELLKEARNYNNWLADQVLAACPGGAQRIIDLGAGCGTFSLLVKERGLNVQCIEPDATNAALLKQAGLPVEEDLSATAPASLDFIFTLNVLEHVPEDEALLTQAFEHLRPGGVLYIFVPAFPLLWSSLDDHVEHQRRYRRRPLVEMLQRVGFTVDCARYADSLGFFAALGFGTKRGAQLTARKIKIYDRILFPASLVLDRLVCGTFGKNLAVTCSKPATRHG